MREIKFRGKRVDNGEWVFGDYSRYSKDQSLIMVDLLEQEDYWVPSETVGQFTGLYDKNGKEVYEGDIVCRKQVVVWETYLDGDGKKWERASKDKKDESATVVYNSNKCRFETGNPKLWLGYYDDIEVIGNIHESGDSK